MANHDLDQEISPLSSPIVPSNISPDSQTSFPPPAGHLPSSDPVSNHRPSNFPRTLSLSGIASTQSDHKPNPSTPPRPSSTSNPSPSTSKTSERIFPIKSVINIRKDINVPHQKNDASINHSNLASHLPSSSKSIASQPSKASTSSDSSPTSSIRSRPFDPLPSIPERPSNASVSQSRSDGYSEKTDLDRRRSDSSDLSCPPSSSESSKFTTHRHSRPPSIKQLPPAAALLINLSGLTDLDTCPTSPVPVSLPLLSPTLSQKSDHTNNRNPILSKSGRSIRPRDIWPRASGIGSCNTTDRSDSQPITPQPSPARTPASSRSCRNSSNGAVPPFSSHSVGPPFRSRNRSLDSEQTTCNQLRSAFQPHSSLHVELPSGPLDHCESTDCSFPNLPGRSHSDSPSLSRSTPQPGQWSHNDPPTRPPLSLASSDHHPDSHNSTSNTTDSSEPYLTTRFEYMSTDDGLMVLTGSKQEITECEDEPIRVPGAIQAFGVLIAAVIHGEALPQPSSRGSSSEAFDPVNAAYAGSAFASCSSDLTEDDMLKITRLEVVQVSENSGHILGLSPKLLLELHSFHEVLSESQAQLLFDNLEVCLDHASTTLAGPHTFRLKGRGVRGSGTDGRRGYQEWSCWCAAHRPDPIGRPRLIIIEFELENDDINPPTTISVEPPREDERGGVSGKPYEPTEQDLFESTRSTTKPLKALARLRKKGKDFTGDSVEVLSILGVVNNQFDKANDMPSFLKMTVGLVRELTGFHRVMIYKFDESWNGQVVAELVDWKRTRDLYRGLRFPASDIPAQAREMYKINKVRMLYDRDQPTARLFCKSQEELNTPLDMTHCHLRAMSPIHIKYLANMGVRASFSISILRNDELWGLISCHSYGRFGQRVTFPTRQFCRLLGESVSRNVHRLHLSQRLQSRKLINTASTSKNPSGYIVAKAEDLLWLFDAEVGVLSIGEEAKLLGTVSNSQEILAVLEYLRIKCFDTIQVSTNITETFPDIEYPAGFDTICGMLVIPLSRGGQDFICFFRPGQLKEVHWAGNPHDKVMRDNDHSRTLEPRKSFKIWSETVKGRAKNWTDEQLETGSVLSLVYGKFIDVWRQKEAAVHNNQLQALLLSNASHEVRTPLHQILSTLELALEGQLDDETRDNLTKSHTASRALVHVINDLLDLTKAEHGGDLFSRDPFPLSTTIEEAVSIHRREAERKGLEFEVVEDPVGTPAVLKGDRARLRQVISNLVGNAVKHTTRGFIHVQWGQLPQEEQAKALSIEDVARISISVTDTGRGIPEAKLESIFRAFEQVGSGESVDNEQTESLGLGLAVVGRVVHNMGGQLRVDSTVDEGSKFTIVLPFTVPVRTATSMSSTHPHSEDSMGMKNSSSSDNASLPLQHARTRRISSQDSQHGSLAGSSSGIDDIVEAIQGPKSSRSSVEVATSRLPFCTSRVRVQDSMSVGSGSASSGHSHFNFNPARRASAGAGGGENGSAEKTNMSASAPAKDTSGPLTTLSNTLEKELLLNTKSALAQRRRETVSKGERPAKPVGEPGSSSSPLPFTCVIGKEGGSQSQTRLSAESKTKVRKPTAEDKMQTATMTGTDPRGLKAPSPNGVEHISEFQRTDRSRTVSKQPMRVMVVEDDPINRVILKKKLTQNGHSVTLTVHGQEAVELFEKDHTQFDIILMDLQMPICDGMEATRRIRAYEAREVYGIGASDALAGLPWSHVVNWGVPIIAVSASLHERQRGDIEAAGMDGWILKPVDFLRLATLMSSAVEVGLRAEEVYQLSLVALSGPV